MPAFPPTARAILFAAIAFSACTSDEPAGTADAGAADTTAAAQTNATGTKAERAATAGISDEDVAYLDSTEVPVYLPALPEGWRLEEVFTERDNENDTFVHFYSATYRTPDSTCVVISGREEGTDGFPPSWPSTPPNERNVTVAGIPVDGPVRLGWGVAGEGATGWEGGLVATEEFVMDGHSYVVETSGDEGCQMASHEDVETFLTSLRALDPALDA
ncbi:MAG TPA: hypothetical protein VGB53_07660 [Rubricoccaceae bacterium]|jgi:hypothetical protein